MTCEPQQCLYFHSPLVKFCTTDGDATENHHDANCFKDRKVVQSYPSCWYRPVFLAMGHYSTFQDHFPVELQLANHLCNAGWAIILLTMHHKSLRSLVKLQFLSNSWINPDSTLAMNKYGLMMGKLPTKKLTNSFQRTVLHISNGRYFPCLGINSDGKNRRIH